MYEIAKEQPFRLLDLPAEIRNRIYEHLIWLSTQRVTRYNGLNGFISLHPLPSLTRASKQLRQESLPIFFDYHTLHLYLYWNHKIQEWLNHDLCEMMLPHVRLLHLQDYQYYRNGVSGGGHRYICVSTIQVDLRKDDEPATWTRDRFCADCPGKWEWRVDRLNAVIRTFDRVDGLWRLTRDNLSEVFNAVAW